MVEQRGEPSPSFSPLLLDVRVPAPVTRDPGSASGACFAGSRFPRSPPFAPPAPPPSVSPALFVGFVATRRGQTSWARASSATAPRLPDADRQCLAGQTQDLPVPVQGTSAHARVFDHAGPSGRSHSAPVRVAFHVSDHVSTRNIDLSRLNTWPVRTPVNASLPPSRETAHDSGPLWIAMSFNVVDFHRLLLAGFTGAPRKSMEPRV
jgi:hypothetical protein